MHLVLIYVHIVREFIKFLLNTVGEKIVVNDVTYLSLVALLLIVLLSN